MGRQACPWHGKGVFMAVSNLPGAQSKDPRPVDAAARSACRPAAMDDAERPVVGGFPGSLLAEVVRRATIMPAREIPDRIHAGAPT
jgi:hypothetical protein